MVFRLYAILTLCYPLDARSHARPGGGRMTQNKWVVWRFANQRWTMLGFVYAETEAEAWDKAHKIYGANITCLIAAG